MHGRGEKWRKAKGKESRCDDHVIKEKSVSGRRRLGCVHNDRARRSGQIRVSHVREETAEGAKRCLMTESRRETSKGRERRR